MSQGRQLVVTRALFLFLAIWTISTAAVYAQQRRDNAASQEANAVSTEVLIMREQLANLTALAAVNTRLTVVERTSEDALTEVREMRKMIYGIAATLLISLLMQVAQIKKGRGTS